MDNITIVNTTVVTHDELESILMPALFDGVGIMNGILLDESEEVKNKISAFNSLLSLGKYIEVRKNTKTNKPRIDISKYRIGGTDATGDGRLLQTTANTA